MENYTRGNLAYRAKCRNALDNRKMGDRNREKRNKIYINSSVTKKKRVTEYRMNMYIVRDMKQLCACVITIHETLKGYKYKKKRKEKGI